MKNHIYILVAMCAIVLINFKASSQAEGWKWAKGYSSWCEIHRLNGEPDNVIINAHLDEDNNVYIFGHGVASARIDGEALLSIPEGQTGPANRAIFLAKYDVGGNLIWKKAYGNRSTSLVAPEPYWAEFKEDKIYIMFTFTRSNTTSYWYDWFGIVNNPAIPTGKWTAFCEFDYDGNLLDSHFIQLQPRENGLPGQRELPQPLFVYFFHVDNTGNINIFSSMICRDTATKPFTLHIDGSTTYDFFSDISTQPYPEEWQYYEYGYDTLYLGIPEYIIIKMNSSWQVETIKPIFDTIITGNFNHYSGGYSYPTQIEGFLGYVSTYIIESMYLNGLSYDEEDNMYLTGYLNFSSSMQGNYPENPYPAYFYFDNEHYLYLQDSSSRMEVGYIVKFNSNLGVEWCNQSYSKIVTQSSMPIRRPFKSNVVNETDVFVVSKATKSLDGVIHYFNNDENELFKGENLNDAFVAKFDRETGQYKGHDVIPATSRLAMGEKPSIINNRLIAMATITHYGSPQFIHIISSWNTDNCTFEEALDTVFGWGIYTNNNGYLFTHYSNTTIDGAQFGDITVIPENCNSCFFALKYAPSILTAYPTQTISVIQHLNENINIYPNPANTELNVEIDDLPNNVKVEYVAITEINGKIITKKSKIKNNLKFNVSAIKNGTYLVNIAINKEIYTKKIIINH